MVIVKDKQMQYRKQLKVKYQIKVNGIILISNIFKIILYVIIYGIIKFKYQKFGLINSI